MCFGYKDHITDQLNPIIRYIAESGADIVCMQEYLEGHTDILTENKIARALSMYPYHFHVPLVHYPRYTTGLAIYSKYPIRSSQKIRYNSSFNGSAVHELNVKGKKMIVVIYLHRLQPYLISKGLLTGKNGRALKVGLSLLN